MGRWCLGVAAAAMTVACSRGAEHPRVASSQRCTLRYHHGSLLLDGDPVTQATAIEHCKPLDGAIVMKDGATAAELENLATSLRGEHVHFFVRDWVGDAPNVAMRVPIVDEKARTPRRVPVAIDTIKTVAVTAPPPTTSLVSATASTVAATVEVLARTLAAQLFTTVVGAPPASTPAGDEPGAPPRPPGRSP